MKYLVEYTLFGGFMAFVLIGCWYVWRAVDCGVSAILGWGC